MKPLIAILAALLIFITLPRKSDAYLPGYPSDPTVTFPGVTFKNIKTDYGATCNGVADDSAAFASWLTYGISQGTTQVGLIIPPGSNCKNCAYSFDQVNGDPGIKNAVIWAFGATCTQASGDRWGGFGFFEDTTHSSLVNTAAFGDTSLTLVTTAESSRYSVGDWILVGALELQATGGFPPNFQFYQFARVIGVNAGTGVVSIDRPLNSTRFKSTYPSVQSDVSMPNNGPVSIFKMQPSWDTNLQIFGLTVKTGSNSTIMSGRVVSCIFCTNIDTGATFSPSVCQTCTVLYSTTGAQEIDKDIENYTFSYSSVTGSTGSPTNIEHQSPAPQNEFMTNSRMASLIGFPISGTYAGMTFITGVTAGVTSFGHSNNSTFINSPVPSGSISNRRVAISDLTYNNDGTFSILKSATHYANMVALFVPGFKYTYTDVNGSIPNCSATPQSLCTFTVSDVSDQGTSIKISTDIPNTFPTVTCSGIACVGIGAYAGGVITQTNSGPANLTQYAPP